MVKWLVDFGYPFRFPFDFDLHLPSYADVPIWRISLSWWTVYLKPHYRFVVVTIFCCRHHVLVGMVRALLFFSVRFHVGLCLFAIFFLASLWFRRPMFFCVVHLVMVMDQCICYVHVMCVSLATFRNYYDLCLVGCVCRFQYPCFL